MNQPAHLEEIRPDHSPRYARSDIGNGNLFADYYRDTARYISERKLWYVYSGKVWEPDVGNLRAMELCKRLADELAIYALSLPESPQRDSYRKFVDRWQIRRNRETILKDAASVYPAKLCDFDSKPHLFNCKNGTLDLRTRAFHEHTPNDIIICRNRDISCFQFSFCEAPQSEACGYIKFGKTRKLYTKNRIPFLQADDIFPSPVFQMRQVVQGRIVPVS